MHQVQSLRVTTRYLDPFEKWESWQPEGHDRRGASPALDAIADNGGEGFFTPFVERRLRDAGIR